MTIEHADPRLDKLIEQLTTMFELARECECDDAARLIGMARLDVQMRMHAISDDELRIYCSALAERCPDPVIPAMADIPLDRGDAADASAFLRRSNGRVPGASADVVAAHARRKSRSG